MLVSTTGYLGTGKTLFLTWMAWNSRQPVYANYSLDLDNAEKIGVKDLNNLDKGLVLIDEAYLWLDSRLSSSEMNRYLSKIIFQSRKRGFNMILSSQIQGAIDLRYRYLQDYRVHALGQDHKNNFRYVVHGRGRVNDFSIDYETARELFDIFDTFEYPDQDSETKTRFEIEDLEEEVNEYCERLRDTYEDPTDLSKGEIKDQMVVWGESSKQIWDQTYYRLKRQARLEET